MAGEIKRPKKEFYDFDGQHAKWVLPRLKYYRENQQGHPINLTREQWIKKLDELIWAFEIRRSKEWWDKHDTCEKTASRYKKAMKLFGRMLPYLWD